MDWRRVLLWLGLAAVHAGAVRAIVRVAMMAFGGSHGESGTERARPARSGSGK